MLRMGEKQVIKWTAEGAVKGDSRVFCNVRHTLVAGDMLVSCKRTVGLTVNQGGTADCV